jgi:hypothetical protein
MSDFHDALLLLAKCSPHVPEDVRQEIANLFDDTCHAWTWIGDQLGLDVNHLKHDDDSEEEP